MRSILVVDDDQYILAAARIYFSRHDMMVETSTGLESARDILSRRSYSVVVTDLCLGGGNGVEGLEVISLAKTSDPSTVVVMITGQGSPEISLESARRGVDAYLEKPFTLHRLMEIIDSIPKGQDQTQ